MDFLVAFSMQKSLLAPQGGSPLLRYVTCKEPMMKLCKKNTLLVVHFINIIYYVNIHFLT